MQESARDILLYLDYNATSPLLPAAKAAMLAALDEVGNASSVHTAGRAARARVDQARRALADILSVTPAQIIFTGSATEANALALHGLPATRMLVGATEHDSVLQNAPQAQLVPVDAQGVIKLEALAALLAESTVPPLVSIMAANNESGVIQPLNEIVPLVKKAGGWLHVDAVQALGRLPLELGDIDMMSLSAHKLGGPQGAGALVVREGLVLNPLIRGGGQERGQRAGTENVAAIAGFGAAALVAAERAQVATWQSWRDELAATLHRHCPEVQIVGEAVPRLANTLLIIHPRLSAEIQLMKLDLAGFAVSAGSACSSGRVKESRVLAAMGYDQKAQTSAIRISFGWNTQKSELEAFAAFWSQM